ncbi:MAG: hypothetical protein KDD22_06135, partial [Bdellovibrionales bacterium]|nr:hypothetical protein [Bdellovibrionales bacterium]
PSVSSPLPIAPATPRSAEVFNSQGGREILPLGESRQPAEDTETRSPATGLDLRSVDPAQDTTGDILNSGRPMRRPQALISPCALRLKSVGKCDNFTAMSNGEFMCDTVVYSENNCRALGGD